MAKRFIDTKLFEDEWFCDLPKDAKLFWLYFITNCTHYGTLKLNKKLCEFQTGLKSIDTIIEQLGNRILRVDEQLLYCSKFLEFQYPNFPNCKFNAALSAIKELERLGIDYLKNKRGVDELLTNSYSNSNGISNSKIILKEEKNKKVSFANSPYFDKIKFKENFPEWNQEKLKYYYEALITWSNEGNKKIDWIATARTWASRDEREGKIKFNKLSTHHSNQPVN